MEEKPSYYAIIPAEVRYDKDLRANEKLLYGEISCLTKYTGECWATNKYFSNLYNVQPNAIATWIRHLKDKQYIEVEYIYKGKEIEKRIIKLGGIQKDNTYSQKDIEGIHKKIGGYSQKGEENNTSKNITSINNTSYFDDDNLNNSINEWFEYKKQRKDKYTEIGKKKLITQIKNNVDKYGVTAVVNLIDECMASNYQGIIFDKLGKPEGKPRFQIESIDERNRRLGI